MGISEELESSTGNLFIESINKRINQTSDEDKSTLKKILQNLIEEMIFKKEKSAEHN
jgi:predicted transcriptional regulator